MCTAALCCDIAAERRRLLWVAVGCWALIYKATAAFSLSHILSISACHTQRLNCYSVSVSISISISIFISISISFSFSQLATWDSLALIIISAIASYSCVLISSQITHPQIALWPGPLVLLCPPLL